MKFKTSDLIARIDALIAERIESASAADAKALESHESSRTEWIAEHGPAYVEFANRIKDKIRKGRPILRDDVPRGAMSRYREFEVFNASKPPRPVPAKVDDLETLKAALLVVADEYVTTTGLREIGFKDIAGLFRSK